MNPRDFYSSVSTGTPISPKMLSRVKALAVHREETRVRQLRSHPIQPNEIDFIKKAVNAPDVNMFLAVI